MKPRPSASVIIMGIIAMIALALGGVIADQFTHADTAAILGVITTMVAPTLVSFVALLRADQTQQQTNGMLQDKVKSALHDVMNEREQNPPENKTEPTNPMGQ